MKSSDVVARQTRQPAMDQERIPVDAKLMTRNAESASQGVNWRRTRISQTRGAAESQPRAYGRDAVAEFDRRKRFHALLDEALLDSGYTRDMAESRTLHEALDEAMDESDEVQESSSHDSGRRKVSKDRSFARDSGNLSRTDYERDERFRGGSYSTDADADFVAEFLDPQQFACDAQHSLYDVSYAGQLDPAKRGYWSGLIHFLTNAPKGTRVKDLNQTALSTLLQKLNEA